MLKKSLLVCMSMASFSCFAATPTSLSLFQTVNERLSYMEDVALYKAQHHKAIEDLPREAVVISKAGESAQKYQLNKASIENFTAAQISVAKAIQYRYRADLLSKPTDSKPRDLTTVIRPALIQLNNELNKNLSTYLASGHKITQNDWPEFKDTLDNHYISESDKRMLFTALEKIKR
ncbi:chorismate mutase [Marinomonas sp.]|uniref:chorismate mutase n=1 Tax=Marinomonas sp. TaxID=1904862 RepID=UPI003C78339B